MVRLLLGFLLLSSCEPALAQAVNTEASINECSTMRVTLGPFTGADGVTPVTPATVTYRIDSRIASGGSYELLDDVALASPGNFNSHTFFVDVPPAVQRLNGRTSPEEHVLSVDWTWTGGGGGRGRKQYAFKVYDVPYFAVCP